MRHIASFFFLCCIVLSPLAASARTLQVGPGKAYAKPSQAAAASVDGDIIEIDAGLYSGDAAVWYRSNLTIRGVGGRAHLRSDGVTVEGKGIWVIYGNNTTIENVEFSGARVPDRNGAGIRHHGTDLTVRNCYFHDNEDGILTGANPEDDIVIERSEFAGNGFGDGYSHNMYIGHAKSFTLRYSYSHHARIGHTVKSRAYTNYLLYNRITDETGTASYEIDLPNGGRSYIIGNLVQQSATTDNSTMISYAAEGASNPLQEVYVVNNTFVNDRGAGTFVRISGTPAASLITNNIFSGAGTVLSGPGTQRSNLVSANPLFVNKAGYDYHLQSGSPAIDAGTEPGQGSGFGLTPGSHYIHPLQSSVRTRAGAAIDIGAYEYGSAAVAPPAAPANLRVN